MRKYYIIQIDFKQRYENWIDIETCPTLRQALLRMKRHIKLDKRWKDMNRIYRIMECEATLTEVASSK